MGKKTTALVAEIDGFSLECAQPSAELNKLQIENRKLQAENLVQIKIMDAVNEEYMPGGHRPPGSEALVEKDKRNIAAVKILEANIKLVNANANVADKLQDKLKAIVPKFRQKLAELEKVIDGKVKDKANAGKYTKMLAFLASSKELLAAVTKLTA